MTMLTRTDYFAIIFPFLVFSGMAYQERTWKYKSKVSLFVLMATLILTFTVGHFLNQVVTKKLNPWVTIAAWDIAGTKNFSSSPVDGYNCQTSDPLVWGEHANFIINLPEGPIVRDRTEEAAEIAQSWVNHVSSHPLAYLMHRLCVAKYFFAYKTNSVHYPYPPPIYKDYGLTQKAERSQLNKSMYWLYDAKANSYMYRYWCYILACILVILVVALVRKGKPGWIASAIFFSVIFSASRVLVLPAVDFRYGLWIVLGTVVLFFMVVDNCLFSLKGLLKNAVQR